MFNLKLKNEDSSGENEFLVQSIDIKNKQKMKEIHDFLKKEKLTIDNQFDYCVVIYNQQKDIIATISKYYNTIKYLVVLNRYQGLNLSNKLVSHINNIIYHQGFNEVFVFTKPEYLKHFQQLGFNLLYGNNSFIFLTNKWDLFQQYLSYLNEQKIINKQNSSIIVLTANPFTKGHQHLISLASKNSEVVYLILVKENFSLFTYNQRKEMVQTGIKNLKNVIFFEGSNYLISKNTFPSYFLSSKKAVIIQQTILDANIFAQYIASALGINKRFVGDEPFSNTTNQYNQTLKQEFKQYQIELKIVPRLKYKNTIISATTVRKLFIIGDFEQLALLVPKSTLKFLKKLNYLEYQKNSNITKLVNKKY